MPNFRNHLPTEAKHMGFDLRRTPASSPLRAIVTSEDFLVCDTHYFHGRTTPHEDVCCPACAQSIPYRTHVYVSAFSSSGREHFLFECTAQAAKVFEEYREVNGTLRGCDFIARRPKGTANGKVLIQASPADLRKLKLPTGPNLALALAIIWRLPKESIQEERAKYRPPTVRTDAAALDILRKPPDNDIDPDDQEIHQNRIAKVLADLEISAGNGSKPE